MAVGPVAGLRGEISVYRSDMFVSTVVDSTDRTDQVADAEAIFLAFEAARSWTAVQVTTPLEGFDMIELFIAEAAIANGLNPTIAFPFRIERIGNPLDYHIIFKTEGGQHDRAAHHRAKIPFSAAGESVRIASVWADEAGIGRYTCPGRWTKTKKEHN